MKEDETVITAETPQAETADAVVEQKPTRVKKKKVKRSVPYGQMHINATFNNTIVTFTDSAGAVLTTSSAGSCGFRGSKKGTAYAAQIAAEKAGTLAKQQFGMSKVDVIVTGVGQGRDTAIRALINLDIVVEKIKDITPIAHGGVRPRKMKRN